MDLLLISYALVLLFHPEYTLEPKAYTDLYESIRRRSDGIPSFAVEADFAVNQTIDVSSNSTRSLRTPCFSNCGKRGMLHSFFLGFR